MNRSRSTSAFLLALIIGAFAGPCAHAEDREQEIKAAYLFSFTKYATWPEGTFAAPTDPIVICILGDNPFTKIDFAERLRNRTAEGRPVQVKFAREVDDLPPEVHLVFIADANRRKLETVLERAKGRAVLTVSDTNRFCAEGGMIGFIRKDEPIRFEVNLSPVEKSGLRLSSNLLKLAQILKGGAE